MNEGQYFFKYKRETDYASNKYNPINYIPLQMSVLKKKKNIGNSAQEL